MKARVKSDVGAALRGLEAGIKSGLEEVMRERAQSTLADLHIAVTGPGRKTRGYAPSPNPGTGLDVPLASLEPNIIGDITGELRSRLTTAVVVKQNKVTAEIGFGKEIRALPGAKENALRHQAGTLNVPRINIAPVPSPGDQTIPPDKTPEQYIPEVLLGTKKLMGRNVLRLALYDDIMNERSLNLIKEKLRQRLRGIRIPF